jgi:tRNA nucleotidyltransferase (CCA-adding enzyme)
LLLSEFIEGLEDVLFHREKLPDIPGRTAAVEILEQMSRAYMASYDESVEEIPDGKSLIDLLIGDIDYQSRNIWIRETKMQLSHLKSRNVDEYDVANQTIREQRHRDLMKKYPKQAAAEDLSTEILRLIEEDPAARVVADELLPYGDVYVVGGAPRDVVLGKQPKDIDMMARVDGDTIMQVLNAVPGGRCIETGNKFPVYRFKYRGSEIEIALPRTEEKVDPNAKGNEGWAVKSDPSIPVEEDLRRRDFTANAIAVHAGTGEVVDPFHGIDDIQNGQIRTVTETSFRDDESRVLRALTQMAKHGLVPDDTTKEQMREYAQYLDRASAEIRMMELEKIIKAGNPHLAIRLAYETGVLEYILPEVAATFGFDQLNPHHKLDLGSHLLEVLENVLDDPDPDLRLAALLHDIGKPASQWVDDQGVGHYYKTKGPEGFLGDDHETVGAEMARERMKSLKFPNERIDAVTGIIQHHMFPAFTTLKGARKFMQNVGGYDNAMRLLKFREADQGGKGNGPGEQDVELMRSLIEQVAAEGQAFTLKDLAIKGGDLIAAGVPAGPEIGRKLNALLEAVVEDPSLNDRNTLLQMAKTASWLEELKESYRQRPDEPNEWGMKAASLVTPWGPPMPKRAKTHDLEKNRRLARARPLEKLQEVVNIVLTAGGGSFDPDTLDVIDIPGYFASLEGHEAKLPLEQFTPRALDKYLSANEPFLQEPNAVLGIWTHKGFVYLDVSRVFGDKDKAIAFARLNNQLAIYDGIKDEEIMLTDAELVEER